MTKQEENWELMTILQIPWSESVKITDPEDRKFLLEKASTLKSHIERMQKQQEVDAARAKSSILTPI
jgi:ribosomal protein S15P/S13E